MLAWWLTPRDEPEPPEVPVATGRLAPSIPGNTPSPGGARTSDARPAAPGTTAAPEDALGAIDPKDAWRAQVASAVGRVARDDLGRRLTPADEQRLVDALASVGPAARSLDREELDPDDPASLERVRRQTQTLVEADRTCRDILGIGVAELLRRLDPSGVEDQGGGATG